jgi:putative transcriptional regulator
MQASILLWHLTKEIIMALREYREKAGLTQGELADLCGLSAGVISHYEKGLKEPRVKNVHKLIEALKSRKVKCTFVDLFPPVA